MKRILSPLWGPLLCAGAATAGAADPVVVDDEWQIRRLMEPTAEKLEAERRGLVVIYDGLTDKTIERAMNEQFDRIESMMFIRTVVTDDEGDPMEDPDIGGLLTLNDGC